MSELNEQQVNLTRLTDTHEEMRAMPNLGQHTHAGTETKQNQTKTQRNQVTEITRMSFTM